MRSCFREIGYEMKIPDVTKETGKPLFKKTGVSILFSRKDCHLVSFMYNDYLKAQILHEDTHMWK